MDGSTHREGRVEACVNGRWGTVCGEGWGDTEAGLVCGKLGFPVAGKFQAYQGVKQYTLTHCSKMLQLMNFEEESSRRYTIYLALHKTVTYLTVQ